MTALPADVSCFIVPSPYKAQENALLHNLYAAILINFARLWLHLFSFASHIEAHSGTHNMPSDSLYQQSLTIVCVHIRLHVCGACESMSFNGSDQNIGVT